MEFIEKSFGKVKIFHLSGKIMGGPETNTMCERLHELLATGVRFLVMDFQNVAWINSNGIGAIIACLRILRHQGGDLRFANLREATRNYFHITKLETVTKVFESVEEAVASFEKDNVSA